MFTESGNSFFKENLCNDLTVGLIPVDRDSAQIAISAKVKGKALNTQAENLQVNV